MTQHFDFREGRSQGLVIYPLSRPEGGLCQVNGGGMAPLRHVNGDVSCNTWHARKHGIVWTQNKMKLWEAPTVPFYNPRSHQRHGKYRTP